MANKQRRGISNPQLQITSLELPTAPAPSLVRGNKQRIDCLLTPVDLTGLPDYPQSSPQDYPQRIGAGLGSGKQNVATATSSRNPSYKVAAPAKRAPDTQNRPKSCVGKVPDSLQETIYRYNRRTAQTSFDPVQLSAQLSVASEQGVADSCPTMNATGGLSGSPQTSLDTNPLRLPERPPEETSTEYSGGAIIGAPPGSLMVSQLIVKRRFQKGD